jgi:hypothetical protein
MGLAAFKSGEHSDMALKEPIRRYTGRKTPDATEWKWTNGQLFHFD